jgi:hypothetical protein
MSQRVKDIHRDLIIADQWTEPHSPWQNPAEFNGVKYLKSHAQVLLDRTGEPDNLWFLEQGYSKFVYNLTAYRQLSLKIAEQVSRGGENTRHIPYPDVLLVWTCTVFGSSLKISMIRNHRKAWILCRICR